MQPAPARRSLICLKPWMAWLAFGPIFACSDGMIGKPQGMKLPGAPGSTGGGGDVTTEACTGQPIPLSAPRVWRLTTTQLKNTLLDVFGFAGSSIDSYPADSRADMTEYANVADKLVIGDLLTNYYNKTAEEVSASIATRSSTFLGCAMTALGAGTCLQDFLKTYGMKAWRRPLSTAEISGLQGLYNTVAAGAGAQTAFAMVVQALILSPSFGFRTELGTSNAAGTMTTMTDFEIASALSYMIWDSPPDQALYDAASAGTLHDPATLRAQVHRMFTDSTRAPVALGWFIAQWLHTDGMPTVKKDATLFPMCNGPVPHREKRRILLDGRHAIGMQPLCDEPAEGHRCPRRIREHPMNLRTEGRRIVQRAGRGGVVESLVGRRIPNHVRQRRCDLEVGHRRHRARRVARPELGAKPEARREDERLHDHRKRRLRPSTCGYRVVKPLKAADFSRRERPPPRLHTVGFQEILKTCPSAQGGHGAAEERTATGRDTRAHFFGCLVVVIRQQVTDHQLVGDVGVLGHVRSRVGRVAVNRTSGEAEDIEQRVLQLRGRQPPDARRRKRDRLPRAGFRGDVAPAARRTRSSWQFHPLRLANHPVTASEDGTKGEPCHPRLQAYEAPASGRWLHGEVSGAGRAAPTLLE